MLTDLDPNDEYNRVSERLWEKLEYYRDQLNLSIDLHESFYMDQLIDLNKNIDIRKLIKEVDEEFDNYGITENQSSWAVMMLVRGGKEAMGRYNKKYGKTLAPRP